LRTYPTTHPISERASKRQAGREEKRETERESERESRDRDRQRQTETDRGSYRDQTYSREHKKAAILEQKVCAPGEAISSPGLMAPQTTSIRQLS